MSEAIIKVENLGKRYHLGAGRSNERYTALRDVIATKAAAPFRALKVKLERRKEKTNGELTAALRPPPSDSELSPCNLPTFKPSHSTPEDRRQIDSVEDSPPSRVRTACKACRHTVREVKSSHHEPGGNKADDQRDERGGEIPRSSLSSNPRAGE